MTGGSIRSIATILVLLCLLLGLGLGSGTVQAQPLPYDWQSPTGSNGNTADEVRDLVVDTVNNCIYAVGVVHGTAPYGLQAYFGIWPLLSPRKDGFLVKLSMDGTLLWAKTLGGTGANELNAVAIGPDGNIVVTGSYRNSLSLGDILTGIFNLGATNGSDILLASYAPSNGSLNWVRAIPGNHGDDRGTGIVALPSGVFITGEYRQQISFGPSSSTVAESHNSDNVFIAKYTLEGTFVASASGGTNGDDKAGKLATDGTQLFTSGMFADEDFRWRNPDGSISAAWSDADDYGIFVHSLDQ